MSRKKQGSDMLMTRRRKRSRRRRRRMIITNRMLIICVWMSLLLENGEQRMNEVLILSKFPVRVTRKGNKRRPRTRKWRVRSRA